MWLRSIPDFPIFGLGSGYTGPRWIALFNLQLGGPDVIRPPGNRYLHVDVGHGQENHEGPYAVIGNYSRLAATAPPGHRPGIGYAMTSLQNAAMNAQMGMLHGLAPVDVGELREAWFADQVKTAERLSSDLFHEEWSVEPIRVADHAVPFWVRRVGAAWAAVAELPQVWIGAHGMGIALGDYGLDVLDPGPYIRSSSA